MGIADATEIVPVSTREGMRRHLRSRIGSYKPNKVDPTLKRELTPAWMQPLLLEMEGILWGRWFYWMDAVGGMKPPTDPIPQIEFEGAPNPTALKMLERCIDLCQAQGMTYWGALEYLMDWVIYGVCGTKPHESFKVDTRASMDLYQAFCLDLMVLYPYDYFGRLLSEVGHGKRTGFYPTPMSVVSAMVQMTMGDVDGDAKSKTVCDPCVGTGRMLLAASNYSLRLYGQDIDYLVLRALTINLWLYAPWGVRPLPDHVWEEGEA